MAHRSDGQEIFAHPQNTGNPMLPIASTADFPVTTEVAVGYQGWPASDHEDESSRSLYVDYAPPVTAITTRAWPVYYVELDLQYNFLPYQASPVWLSMIRVYINDVF